MNNFYLTATLLAIAIVCSMASLVVYSIVNTTPIVINSIMLGYLIANKPTTGTSLVQSIMSKFKIPKISFVSPIKISSSTTSTTVEPQSGNTTPTAEPSNN